MKISYRSIVGRMMDVELLRRIYLQKAAQKSGLYLGQLPILKFIHKHPGCTQREIAEDLGVTPASIALSTKRMQKAGLLVKGIDAKDLRCNKLELTETGLAYMHECTDKFETIDRISFVDFTDEEADLMITLLDKILRNMIQSPELEQIDAGSLLHDHFKLMSLAHNLETESNEKKSKEDDL